MQNYNEFEDVRTENAMNIQTPAVIIGEAVAATLIAGFVTFFIKKLIGGRPREAGVSVKTAIGDKTTNSPMAVGATVHQSNTYNMVAPSETAQPPDLESSPSPEEVRGYFADLTPYQQLQSRNHHSGIKVHWRLVYETINQGPDPNGNAQIMARSLPSKRHAFGVPVFFWIGLDDHPKFRIVHSGEIFWLDGTIDETGEGSNPIIYVNCTAIKWESQWVQ